MKSSPLKKGITLLLCAVLVLGMLTACEQPQTAPVPDETETPVQPAGPHGAALTDLSLDERGKASLLAPIPLSGFEDVSDAERGCTYSMRAELTDSYTFSCERAQSITVTTPAGTVQGTTTVQAAVTAGDTVIIQVTTVEKHQKFLLNVQADNHVKRLPYEPHFTVDSDSLDLDGDGAVPAATQIVYQKREGGTYVYLNNPEMLKVEDIGQAILRDEGLSGDVQVTWEHSNHTGQQIYLGYQLKNDGTTDAYVTVTNIGMQTTGEWLGQRSWSDYYNYKFDLPADYFDENGEESERYRNQDFLDYTPRVFQPTTYRIPAGEYIYVLGGTSPDAYNFTDVGNTADKPIFPGCCTNAVAKFFVTGGAVTGTLYCYTNASQVQAEPEEQGYVVERGDSNYGLQYKGVDYHTALIESNPVFIVNDETPTGDLPVTYENSYDKLAHNRSNKAYAALQSKTYTQEGTRWSTNLNPQNGKLAVGTDMSSFTCETVDGQTVTMDNEHLDGTATPGNFGNWMIDYHDNITLVNQGDQPRTFTINKQAHGALMTMILTPEGEVLKTKCTIIPITEPATELQWELYTVEVPPHSALQFTVSFLLMGNSYGNVNHWITVE